MKGGRIHTQPLSKLWRHCSECLLRYLDLERAVAALHLFEQLASPRSVDDALGGCTLMELVEVGARRRHNQDDGWTCQQMFPIFVRHRFDGCMPISVVEILKVIDLMILAV